MAKRIKKKETDDFFPATIDNHDKFIIGEVYRLYFKTEEKSILDVYGVLISSKLSKHGDVIIGDCLTFKCISCFEKLTKKDPYTWNINPGDEFTWYLSDENINPGEKFAKITC